jgi:hypothetical protein
MSKNMQLCVKLGEAQKTTLCYQFNQLLGMTVITYEDRVIMKSWRLFNEPMREVHVVEVKVPDRTEVRIEKERGALIEEKARVFVNNHLAKVVRGY